MEITWKPRQGKTARVRVLACAAALDPLAELWLAELKGSGDLDPLEACSHRFVSGIHDEAISYAAQSLRLLRTEIGRRTDRLKARQERHVPPRHPAVWVRIAGTWRKGLIATWIQLDSGRWECVITADEPGGSAPWQGRYRYDPDAIRPRHGDGPPG